MVALLLGLLFSTLVAGQLSGKVGPTTSIASKRAVKVCNISSYGAKADGTTDAGPAINAAMKACINGGVVVIPSGNFALGTYVSVNNAKGMAVQLDGIITRTGSAGGNMIAITRANDFEFFSSTGKGAIQGHGYQLHAVGNRAGARILRLIQSTNFAVHDLALVDAPAFHFTLDTCTNGEVYNMAIRGGDEGGLDGIDVWGTNIHVHDIMVTNKDECVTVKSPAHNFLIENIYCNWSGGSAIGSLGQGTDIGDIIYRKVYTWNSNQMMMIKSNGGSGTVRGVTFENFIGHGNAYSLDIDGYWSSLSRQPGNGVKLQDITVSQWTGTESNGAQRGPIKVVCDDSTPCTGITIKDFALWTEQGNSQTYTCESAYGSGGCLRAGNGASYAKIITTVKTAPAGYQAPYMPYDLKTAFGTAASIPIPTHPASYFPNTPPLSAAP